VDKKKKSLRDDIFVAPDYGVSSFERFQAGVKNKESFGVGTQILNGVKASIRRNGKELVCND